LTAVNNKFKKAESLLPKALRADQTSARRKINSLKRSSGRSLPAERLKKQLLHIEKQLASSAKKKKWRIQNRPSLSYNEALPIVDKKNEIIESIKKNRVVIISGETGSGKTTQIPKFCLAAGRGIDGKIGCTQPRRIATTTVARRVAEEIGEELGKSVGYKIRFKDRTHPDAFIKFMTDGILLAETQNDPELNQYDTIIVDEAHERSLNIDFILGILKTLLKQRKGLKLIITSATIDTEKFSRAFDNAPVIEVSGRMYPVEVRYFTDAQEDEEVSELANMEYVETAVQVVDSLQNEASSGDILIFMPTEQDIRETCETIEGKKYKGVTVLPLFARLSGSEQSRVFSKMSGRKIIVATNIAETSITIPGIKYVIDSGLARISQYLPRSRTTSLSIKSISRSSANQRKGRCGRIENGICIRLFHEEDYESRPLFTPPEILRANLAEVILRMIALKLGDMDDFPFIDKPAQKSIRDGFDLLLELGAIIHDSDKKQPKSSNRFSLTDQGRLMARIPIDPRLSRMLIEAHKRGCLEEVSIIASALSVQDPRERPSEKAEEADLKHALFKDTSSDFITLLNVWEKYQETWRQKKSMGKMKRYCKEHFLSFRRMREWRDVYAQISAILKEHKMHYSNQVDSINSKSATGKSGISKRTIQKQSGIVSKKDEFSSLYTSIHKSILSGFLSNIAMKKADNIFRVAGDREVMIFPGSTLFNRTKSWVVAAELVETSRLFARIVAGIDSDWLEDLGKALCKRTYLKPHWERNRGEVVASEQVSLFGLIIVPGRPISYGRIDPEEASDIFVRSALVEGDVKKPFEFMNHNQKLVDSITDMENRIRRRDLLTASEEIFRFYHRELKGCFDIRTLRNHIKKRGNDHHLRMQQEDLLRHSPDTEELALFPDRVILGDNSFDCDYKFNPGKPDDGLTIEIPSSAAAMVPRESIDWLVPGLYREKIMMLIKGLPKSYRKQLVPVANTTDIILKEMPKTEVALITTLGNFIYERFKVDIPAPAWPDNLLPDHLRARVTITGPKGEALATGRDPSILKQHIVESTDPDEFESTRKVWEKSGITSWDFGDLPDEIPIKVKSGTRWVVYPGLVKGDGDDRSVELRLFRNRDNAQKSHRTGVAVLFINLFAKDLKYLKRHLTPPEKMAGNFSPFENARDLKKQVYERIIKDLFHKDIRSEKAFCAYAESVAPAMLKTGQDYLNRITPVLKAFHETDSVISSMKATHRFNKSAVQFLGDLRKELTRLVPETFLDLYDSKRFIHIVRYVTAIRVRVQRALVSLEKDRTKAAEAIYFSEKLNKLLSELSPTASNEKKSALEDFFWSIEEYKVSLFAQELKTAGPVSKKRLESRLKEIQRMV